MPSSNRKRTYIAAAIALVFACCATGYWRYYRIISDVPVFAPPEWVWLDGAVEVMVFPDRDDLLIRRSRLMSNVVKPPQDSVEARVYRSRQQEARIRRSEAQSPVGSPNGIFSTSSLRNDYYYLYDTSEGILSSVSDDRWKNSEGIITASDIHRWKILVYQVRGTSIHLTDYRKKLHAGRDIPEPGKYRRLWNVPTPIVAACSARRRMSTEELEERFVSCYSERAEIIAGMDPPSLVAHVYMEQDRRSRGGVGLVGGGSSTPAISGRQHFVRFISLPNVKDVGLPVRISMVTDLYGKTATPDRDYLLDMVWSADSRYVVFVGLTSLAIVDVEKLATSN